MDGSAAAVRLHGTYDVQRLLEDVRACERVRSDWVTHEQVMEGRSAGWAVLPLRSRGGNVEDACARTNSPEPFRDTILFEHSPYIREIIAGLETTATSVRLSALQAGGKIHEHSDGPGMEIGTGPTVRLHLPLVTNDDVWFVLDGRRYEMRPGELWYGNFSKTHWVENRGREARIHLLLDVRLSAGVLRRFPPEYLAGRDIEPVAVVAEAPRDVPTMPEFSFELGGLDGELEAAIAPLSDGFKDILRATFGGRNEVRWIDGELWAVIQGHPTFLLEVVSRERLAIADQDAAVELEWVDDTVARGTLDLNVFDQRFKLPLRVGKLA